MPDGSENVIDETAMFQPGDVFVIGDAVPIPMKIHVELAQERPQSGQSLSGIDGEVRSFLMLRMPQQNISRDDGGRRDGTEADVYHENCGQRCFP